MTQPEQEAREMLALFVRESNWIEGIRRNPTEAEIDAHEAFLNWPAIDLGSIVDLVAVLQPDARLRDRKGLDVYVGGHVPPPGGYAIPLALCDILDRAADAYQTHVEYETLHPFTDGNGRSGRALWLRMMGGNAPLGFLHHWYYQSLAGSGFRGKADTTAFAARPTAGIDREVVARLIDPLAFKSAESMLEYCTRQNDPHDVAQRYVDRTYGPSMQEALTKADAILALLPAPAKTRERGAVIEECAIAARNAMVDMEWPPQDGDREIDEVLAAIRALSQPLPDAPIVGGEEGKL